MLSLCQSPLHNLKSTRSKEGHSALSSVIAHKGTMTPASCPYQTSLDATLYVESVRVSVGPVRSVNETLPPPTSFPRLVAYRVPQPCNLDGISKNIQEENSARYFRVQSEREQTFRLLGQSHKKSTVSVN